MIQALRPPHARAVVFGGVAVAWAMATACGTSIEERSPDPTRPIGRPPERLKPPPEPSPLPPPAPKPLPPLPDDDPPADPLGACPEGMVYVDLDHCTRITQRCLDPPSSNLNVRCQRWDAARTCVGPKRRQRFCIDRYEYPNQRGAHPRVMLDAADAAAICHQHGKRLCWESEWTAACEGARALPYPYGLTRDPTKCRIDIPTPMYRRSALRSRSRAVRDRELRRIDRSVPSGAMTDCKSDLGVYDLTGNFSEWVFLERPRGNNRWAGQKGGHWKPPIRNACRPTGVGHNEPWTFYTLSLRCCADPDPSALAKAPAPAPDAPKRAPLWTPPKPPKRFYPDTPRRRGWPTP